MNVTAIKESDWDKKDGSPIVHVIEVTLDDGRKAPGYDLPLTPEVGKPLPDGWEFATGKSGKPYIKVPNQKKGQAPAAYRNTEKGFHEEQASIHRSVALQRAIEYTQTVTVVGTQDDRRELFTIADEFYTWLRAGGSLPGASPSSVVTANTGGAGREGPATETKAEAVLVARPSDSSPSPSGSAEGSAGKSGVEGVAAPTPQGSSAGEQAPDGNGDDSPGACSSCGSTVVSRLVPNSDKLLPHGLVRCVSCGTTWKQVA